MNFQAAFDSFMENDFEDAVDSSTSAGYGGSGYSVELFRDGTYEVLWDGSIGNLYDSEGIILKVPQLSEDDQDSEDPDNNFYGNVEDYMIDLFSEKIKELAIA